MDRATDVINIASIPFEATQLTKAAERVIELGMSRRPVSVRLVNAYTVVCAHEDIEYLKLLNSGGLNFPDGRPIATIARLLSDSPKGQVEQVRGPTLFRQVLKTSQEQSCRHFFLGASDETLRKLSVVVRNSYPNAVISGLYSPPFGPVDNTFLDECAERVRQAQPDIVWVALGTPKQDSVAAALSQRCGVTCVAVGAAFDYLAGTVREAPAIFGKIGLEWLYRLLVEPKRLWRRYLIGNVKFLRLVLVSILRKRDAVQT